MKALVCDSFGSIDDARCRDVADPVAGPDDVLVAVKAAGVGFYDVLFAEGRYQIKPPPPFILGCEVAGEVVEVGARVTRLRPGDRVFSLAIDFGSFAEKMVLPGWLPTRLPVCLSYPDAGALMSSFGTAQHALRQRGGLRGGETLLVTGAAGGTGSAAIQIGKAIGARVIAVCSSEERAAYCRAQGASEVIDYSRQDVKQAVKELTGGQGVDVAFETVGGDLFDTCARLMAFNGRLLAVGFASGRLPSLSVNLPLVRGYSLIGVNWLSFVRQCPLEHEANMNELVQWLESGALRSTTTSIMPLDQGQDALRRIAARESIGKIVLTP